MTPNLHALFQNQAQLIIHFGRQVSLNKINPKKMLNSKWTAVNPIGREKHFLVTEIEFSEEGEVIECFIEPIISKQSKSIDWQELKNKGLWFQGWK